MKSSGRPKATSRRKRAITVLGPDPTGRQLDTRFKPGAEWTGNAAGRPKGSRNKISEDFLNDFYEAWKEHGRRALMAAATTDPVAFVRVAASLLPKELEINKPHDPLKDMPDEEFYELVAMIKDLHAAAEKEGFIANDKPAKAVESTGNDKRKVLN